MRIVKIIVGLLLGIGGTASSILFGVALILFRYAKFGWCDCPQPSVNPWTPFLTICAIETFISLIIAVAGFKLTWHEFGIYKMKDWTLSIVIAVSLIAWTIAGCFMVFYRWN